MNKQLLIQPTMLMLFLVLFVTCSLSHASSSSMDPKNVDFSYSLLFDMSSDDDEQQQQQQKPAFVVDGKISGTKNDSSKSSLLVSSQTIMYNNNDNEFISLTSDEADLYAAMDDYYKSNNLYDNNDMTTSTWDQQYESDMESDDEDDDDDDDGHSSMLSNASVLQSKQVLSLPRGGGGGTGTAKSLFQSEMSKKLITTALVTLVFEAIIGHILEFLKIVMQTAETSYIQVIQSITKEKGIAGLWDGFCPWGIVQAVLKGGVFGLAHASAAKVLVPLAEKNKYFPMQLALTLAGGIGGGFQGYVLSPTLLLKTRVMTNPVFREQMSMLRTTLLSFRIGFDVVQQEGFWTLMKGSNVFALKRVFDWASRYFFSDMFEALFVKLKGEALTVSEKSVASLLGGVASTCVTLPLDVLVAKTQDAKKAGVAVSALQLFRDELNEKGLKGLQRAYMRGFEARLAHVCLTTVVVKTFTPVAYEKLFGSKR